MTEQTRSRGNSTSTLLVIATATFASGIFIADTSTKARDRGAGALRGGCADGVAVSSGAAYRPRGPRVRGPDHLELFFTDHGLTRAGIVNTLISIATIALTTFLVLQRQAAEMTLRDRASLLDLTHDTIFVRDMNDVITYWNRGAAELYGWTREQAIGKVTHQLMQTVFPATLEKINEELLRTGRWEGELTHTKRDGTQVVVASRWSLQRDA